MNSLPHDSSLGVLLVDDEPMLLDLFEMLLLSNGYRVGTASDAAAALEKFKAEKWDLVITDFSMPGLTGSQLGQEIKSLSPGTPVIVLTGDASADEYSGADLVIHKPFTHSDIETAIARCLAAA